MLDLLTAILLYADYIYIVVRCTTGPRRAANNASSLDRRDAPLGLAEL